MSVLLIAPDTDHWRGVQAILEAQYGLQIDRAHTLEETLAWLRAKQQSYRAVVQDLPLGIDGNRQLRALKPACQWLLPSGCTTLMVIESVRRAVRLIP